MRITDTSITLGSGNCGQTSKPGDRGTVILKTSPVISCIGNLDKVVSYMQICISSNKDEDLHRIYEALCSLFTIIPCDGLTSLGDALYDKEEFAGIHAAIVRMALLNKHLVKKIEEKKDVQLGEYTEARALSLNYLRALMREFEVMIYNYFLYCSVIVQGATDDIKVPTRDGDVPLKGHFALSTILEFLNVASDYAMILAADLNAKENVEE